MKNDLHDDHIPGREGGAWIVKEGQHIRIEDAEGGPLGVPPFGCYEVLQKTLKDWPIAPHNIPEPFNLFQTVRFDLETGGMVTVDATSKVGDYIDMVARMDALCGLSSCPGAGKALRVRVYEP